MLESELEMGLALWQRAVMDDPKARWDAARDLSYWAQAAQRYEAAHIPLPRTTAAIRTRLDLEWSLLDAGAGTGRFTRGLASAVKQVTALDYSPDMLRVLEQHPPLNVSPRLGTFQDPTLPIHDAVLCAWALYRSPDLRADVASLWKLTRRTLMVLEDNGTAAPHLDWRSGKTRLPFSRTELITGLLQMWTPDVEVTQIEEERVQTFADEMEFLAFARIEKVRQAVFLEDIAPFLQRTSDGLRYSYTSVVTLVAAHRVEDASG